MTRNALHPHVMLTGVGSHDVRSSAIAAETASEGFGTVHVAIGTDVDLYLTTDGATALRDRLSATLDHLVPRYSVVADADTGETLTPPLPHDDATAVAASTTGRNVHVQAVTR